MKITKLQAENFKKIKAVQITPKGNIIKITGKNAQGKTSILDSIFMTLAGRKGAKEVTKPVRDGELQAKVVIDLGEYQVTREWNGNGNTRLTIESDGAVYKSPQSVLDKIIGDLTFDPLEFSRMDEKKQKELLIGLLGIQDKIDELELRYENISQDRLFCGRELKTVKGNFDSIAMPVGEKPEFIRIDDLQSQLLTAERNNVEHEYLVKAIENIDYSIADLTSKIEQLKRDKKNYSEKLKTTRVVDISNLKSKIEKARENNKKLEDHNNYLSSKEKLEKKELEYLEYTEKIKAIVEEKNKIVSDSKLPVDGLNVTGIGVTYNGVPFKDLSSAEKLKISLSIAMTMNPKLKVIRITDGSLLDSENMKVIESMANENDYQIWMECVDESGRVGVYIEDGQIGKDNQ